MVRVDEDAEIPESGAVFTFGKSKFADNNPSKFWIRNDTVAKISCGDEHTIVITGNGRVYGFGNNDWGQLGLGNTKSVVKPSCIKFLKHEKAVDAAGGRSHSLIATESGKVYSFGGNSEGQLGTGETTSDRCNDPQLIEGIEGQPKMVSAGSYHSAVLTVSGKLFLFGSNAEGQLGLEDVKKVNKPTELQLAINITHVACGYYHTAVVGDGKVYTFGEKEGGKLGLLEKQLQKGANRPQCIFSIADKVVSVACGGNHTAVLTECGKLYTFGSGLNGQLGLGTMVMETGCPSVVGALEGQNVINVSCGESHTAIVTDLGRLYTCGDGRHGKLALGNENFSNQFNPVHVKKFSGYFVHQVACGGCHMLVLASKKPEDELDGVYGDEIEASTITGNQDSLLNGRENNPEVEFAARTRRRQKDIMQNRQLPAIGRPLPPLNPSITEPAQEQEKSEADNKLDELEQLEKQLLELEKQDSPEKILDSAMKDEDVKSIISETSQLNKTHELNLTDSNTNKILPVKSPVKAQIYEISKSAESAAEGVRSANTEMDGRKSTDTEAESEDDEGGEVESEEENGNEEPTEDVAVAENADSLQNSTEKTTENSESKPKKDSFLKRIFNFKKNNKDGIFKSQNNNQENDKEGAQNQKGTKGGEDIQKNAEKVEDVREESQKNVSSKVDNTEQQNQKEQTDSKQKPASGSGRTKSANQVSKACTII